MIKNLYIALVTLLIPLGLLAQEEESQPQEVDSLQTDLREQGIMVQDSLVEKRKPINPLAPSRAAFYSAVIPGMGQIYNKRYWKVPIVYGALGASIYWYTWNDDNYDRFRIAFKRRRAGFTDDEFYDTNGDGIGPDFDDDVLQNQQERFQRDRDLALVVTIGLYILNIVDANVDAHLKQFNISNDLSFDIQPFLDLNTVNRDPNYGLALVVKF